MKLVSPPCREQARERGLTAMSVTLTQARLLRIPIRMRRPAGAGRALGFSPLVQAGRADSSRVERVPFKEARANPLVFLTG
jgi:hypothetical protein